jgi:hypothetical protein
MAVKLWIVIFWILTMHNAGHRNQQVSSKCRCQDRRNCCLVMWQTYCIELHQPGTNRYPKVICMQKNKAVCLSQDKLIYTGHYRKHIFKENQN